MKTSLLSRLSLLGLTLALSTTIAAAQTAVFTEAPIIAKTGYWTLETCPKTQNYTLVSFYNDEHELLYKEQLNGIYLDPTKSVAAHRRISRMLGTSLDQVQRLQANSLVSNGLFALNRYSQRLYAAR